jgi:hypothetical protein
MTDWTNPGDRESAIASKWADASDEVDQLKAINADMLATLEKLTNEANAIAEMARPCIGNTNVACLLTRCTEARAAIARAKGEA